MEDLVRVTRVLVYEGTRKQVEEQVARSLGNGTRRFGPGATITTQTIGSFPTVIASAEALEASRADGFLAGKKEGLAEGLGLVEGV